MRKLFFGLAMLLFCAGYVGAQNLYTLHPPKELTPAEKEAARKRNEEQRRAEEARKAQVEAEKRRLGLGRHRDEEAEKFLKMKQQAEAGRSNKFGTAQSKLETQKKSAALKNEQEKTNPPVPSGPYRTPASSGGIVVDDAKPVARTREQIAEQVAQERELATRQARMAAEREKYDAKRRAMIEEQLRLRRKQGARQ